MVQKVPTVQSMGSCLMSRESSPRAAANWSPRSLASLGTASSNG